MGHAGRKSRAGRQSYPLENKGSAARWRARRARARHVHRDRQRASRRRHGLGRGCIVLASHFGAHLLPAHWLFRENFPVRFYMERPRHISRFLSRHFETEGPLGQDKLFISRQGVPADSASSILRAARAIKAGMLLYLAGDVRWTGRLTESASLPGPQHEILDDLGCSGRDDGGAGRHGVLSHGAGRSLPYRVSPGVSRSQGCTGEGKSAGLGPALHRDPGRSGSPYPSNSNDYFFWSDPETRSPRRPCLAGGTRHGCSRRVPVVELGFAAPGLGWCWR